MADTGPRGPQGPAGTSIDLPVAVANGGTGATTRAGAKSNLGLEGLACNTYEVAPSTTVRLTFTSNTNAVIMATGSAGKSFATLLYIGYGVGGPNRAHIAELQLGASVTYALSAEDAEGNTHGLTITNANEDNKLYVSVLTLRGGLPTVAAL